MTGSMIASIITILGALILATRGLGRRAQPGTRWKMALAWVAIIVGVTFLIGISGVSWDR